MHPLYMGRDASCPCVLLEPCPEMLTTDREAAFPRLFSKGKMGKGKREVGWKSPWTFGFVHRDTLRHMVTADPPLAFENLME
jgi:hypothetical protein